MISNLAGGLNRLVYRILKEKDYLKCGIDSHGI